MTVILKLGGSVITEKSSPETVDNRALSESTQAVADALGTGVVDSLVVVHGGGSFGHYHANVHGVSTTAGTTDADAVAAICGAMARLNETVCTMLRERDVPAVAIHPLSLAYRDHSGQLVVPTGAIEALFSEGFVPVVHGDLVADVGSGLTVASGDELIVELAHGLGADRVGLCSAVPGVLDADGLVIDRIEDYETVEAVLGESDTTDVTGGMAAKVRALLDLDADASIFGREHLPAFLRGEAVGTTVS